jgi:hypothetical protein
MMMILAPDTMGQKTEITGIGCIAKKPAWFVRLVASPDWRRDLRVLCGIGVIVGCRRWCRTSQSRNLAIAFVPKVRKRNALGKSARGGLRRLRSKENGDKNV